jgi:hypothetical protein
VSDFLALCCVAGSIKVEAASEEAATSENSAPETQPMTADKLSSVPMATPSFLPPDALRALAARGMVGTVACVLDA